VRGWRLQALLRLRDAEARDAACDAARARARMAEAGDAAVLAEARAVASRRQAVTGEEGPGGAEEHGGACPLASILALGAAGRARADAAARRLSVESGRAGRRAMEARSQAARALGEAAAARARTDALGRVGERWRAAACAVREAALEREVEEAWRSG